ncbi:hypothetical protein [Allochromatium palmeri]|uniref:Uncharacterized protein n=1 Tax=Allochromatium palmeri TaxID=231048 RepID=A0A6N8EI08_9GAMM|nr:hypothetical protein [Allochromatium palmeri]MTW23251.1 hypothetical protein [Allochromatium palmeri]
MNSDTEAKMAQVKINGKPPNDGTQPSARIARRLMLALATEKQEII